MRRSDPPRAAIWLLEHLVPGTMHDALAGDLAEEFARRGAAWYWRQVLLAIVAGCFRYVRQEWSSVAFAFGWIFIGGESLARLNTWLFAWAPRGPWWIGLPWPWSLVVEIAREIVFSLVPVVFGLIVHLLVARRLSAGGILAGIGTVLAGLTVCDVGMTLVRGNHARMFWFVPAFLYSLVLLLAIWTGQRRTARRSLSY